MNLDFKVSVVIPVFNAEQYLEIAVESAVILEEVGEILLIEDKSPDKALEVCTRLEKKYSKVKVLQHPNGENKGAGASRNLGITMATCNYIAFLDADDWYLPNRFYAEAELFKEPKVDGVYGATGRFLENKQTYSQDITTFTKPIKPENLLEYLITHKDSFHINAITVKKSLLLECGLFSTSLNLHQDTHLWYKLAFFGKLCPGNITTPVAIRRVHNDNRITHRNFDSKAKFHQEVFKDFKKYSNVSQKIRRILFNRYIHSLSKRKVVILKHYLLHFIHDPFLLKLYV